jgi:aminoglycoside N3'-acetyltransferase
VNLSRLLSWLPPETREAVRNRARSVRARAIAVWRSYSVRELESALRALGIAEGDSLVVHAAFRPLNGFRGEPVHIIDCLLDIIGPKGHLMMLSMPYGGTARDYLAWHPVFDARRTPSRMGVISECFRRRRGVLRSLNPLHPVLAWGPRAEWIVAGHEALAHSCGKGSPFERMLALDTKALFFDVGLETLTFAHYLEEMFSDTAPVPVYAEAPVEVSIVDAGGQRTRASVFPFAPEALQLRNFSVLYDALIADRLVGQLRVGNTRLRLTRLVDVVEQATRLHNEGTHVYALPGTKARVPPAPAGTAVRVAARVRHELRTARIARRLARSASRRVAPAPHGLAAWRLNAEALREVRVDSLQLLGGDAGIARTVEATMRWICEAQDRSASHDGGLSRDYELGQGWSPSDAGSSGDALPVILGHAERSRSDRLFDRAERILDWLLTLELSAGGFAGGAAGEAPPVAVPFATGQVLHGLAAAASSFDDEAIVQAMHRTARWLTQQQDVDGCWRMHGASGERPAETSFDTHIASALLEAARMAPGLGYENAALRNIDWALTHQRSNGWFGRCCQEEPSQPLSLGIGRALRGVIEAFSFSGDVRYLEAGSRTGDSLARVIDASGHLPGRLHSDWSTSVPWVCLAGTSHVAHALLRLYEATGTSSYLEAARRANVFVRRAISIAGPAGLCGGVKGSFPVHGGYFTLRLPSWGATAAVGANVAEQVVLWQAEGERVVA